MRAFPFIVCSVFPVVAAAATSPAPIDFSDSVCLRGCLQNTALANFTTELRTCLAKPDVTDATICWCDTGERLNDLGRCVATSCGYCLNAKTNTTCTVNPVFGYLRDICPAAVENVPEDLYSGGRAPPGGISVPVLLAVAMALITIV